MKFLIDECLSPELAELAQKRGYPESTHLVHRGKGGIKDWYLLPIILEGDWTFVTCNSYDFRGPSDAPGTRGEYRVVEIHAGLICLNAAEMDLALQLELFGFALDALEEDGDLVNQVLEVSIFDGDQVEVLRYALPAEAAKS